MIAIGSREMMKNNSSAGDQFRLEAQRWVVFGSPGLNSACLTWNVNVTVGVGPRPFIVHFEINLTKDLRRFALKLGRV